MEAPAIDAPAADWLVYGDALQQAGDPRGELIGLSHAVAEGTLSSDVRDAYVKEHAAALLGEAAPHFASYRFDWRFCVPVSVSVRITAQDGDLVGALLAAPLARDLRAITLVGATADRRRVDLAPAMQQLLAKRPPSLTSFAFVDERASKASMLISRDYDPGQNLVTLGPVAPFFAFAEEIHLEVADSYQIELSPMNAPELRAFTFNNLRFCEYDNARTMTRRLADAVLPKIERYAVRLTELFVANIVREENPYLPVYSEYYAEQAEEEPEDPDDDPPENRYDAEAEDGSAEGVDWRELDGLLGRLAGCPLRHLALTGFDSSRSLIEALDRKGFAPTLETLDLSDSSLSDDDAAWMAAHPTRFAKLKRIVVERTALSEAGARTLRNLGPEVVHSHGDTRYRYVVGSE